MGEVVLRDAAVGDAPALAEVHGSAVPYLVRTAAGVAFAIRQDRAGGHRRRVAVRDRVVVGEALTKPRGDATVSLGLVVHVDSRRLGIGSRLLADALDALPAGTTVSAVCDEETAGFAAAHRFEGGSLHQVSVTDPRAAGPAGPAPAGLRAVCCADLGDLQPLLDANNACAADDPSGLSRTATMTEFRAFWWDEPENAPDLAFALLDGALVAGFTMVKADRDRGRAWSSMTATRPAYRGRGLATWLKRRTMTALAGAGVREAWTANDRRNAPMLAVNAALGYRPAAAMRSVRREL